MTLKHITVKIVFLPRIKDGLVNARGQLINQKREIETGEARCSTRGVYERVIAESFEVELPQPL